MSHLQVHVAAGRKSQPPRYRFETHDYEQFQLIHVSTGELHFSDGVTHSVLSSGHLALLRIGSAFQLWTEGLGYQGVYLLSAGETRPEFTGRALALKADHAIRTLAKLMEREIAVPAVHSQPLLLNFGWAMAWQALRLHSVRSLCPASPDYGRAMAESARQALEATLFSGQNVHEALASFELSYRQLARHFFNCFQVSPKQYQRRARMREAERLLGGTRASITDIAFELGFASSQHFASQFYAHCAQTPSAYRRSAQRPR